VRVHGAIHGLTPACRRSVGEHQPYRFTDFAPIWVNASRFPAALYGSRLSKYHLYHTAHTPVLMLTVHGG
jgi:hypothetical protein